MVPGSWCFVFFVYNVDCGVMGSLQAYPGAFPIGTKAYAPFVADILEAGAQGALFLRNLGNGV